ncbi:hypothetical protein AURDEDRAFT_160288 [Auricularia subglabra TFB-10046 SS5]|nr:hypothetical protein AURDEDRAFT_160288 [Auricularia subglabra TFB-10046 SS5]
MAYQLAPALQYLIFWTVEVIMQMRVFALYKSRALAVTNGVFFFCEILAMILMWLMSPYMLGSANRSRSGDRIPALASGGTNLVIHSVALIYWTPGMAFELWLAALAVVKMRRKVLKHELLGVLLSDSLVYFLMITMFMVLHVVLSMYQHGNYAVPFVIVGETVGGSRLVLHLRKAYWVRRDGASAGASQPNISFALPVQTHAAHSSRVVDESFYEDD